jgi:type III secretion protein Q
MREVRSYPYDRWPRMSVREAESLRAWARATPLQDLIESAPEVARWLGVAPAISPGVPAIARVGFDPADAVLFEEDGGARAALVLDPRIASALLDRCVGGDGAGLEAAVGPLQNVERGLLAYAFARWLASSRSRFRVASILGSRDALDLALGPAPHVRWPFELGIGRSRGPGVLWLAADGGAARARGAPAWIGELDVELILHAGHATLAASVIAELAVGDIVVVDGCTLAIDERAVAGHAELRARSTSWTWRAQIEPDALRIEREGLGGSFASSKEVDVEDASAVLGKIGDTPVTLVLELARFAVPLAEVAAFGPGEVVRTGRPIGDRVVLRAGDRIVATGELVDVGGEIGVRLISITGDSGR